MPQKRKTRSHGIIGLHPLLPRGSDDQVWGTSEKRDWLTFSGGYWRAGIFSSRWSRPRQARSLAAMTGSKGPCWSEPRPHHDSLALVSVPRQAPGSPQTPSPLSPEHLGTGSPPPPSAPVCCDSLRPGQFLPTVWELRSRPAPSPEPVSAVCGFGWVTTCLNPLFSIVKCGLMVPALQGCCEENWWKLCETAANTGLSLPPSPLWVSTR